MRKAEDVSAPDRPKWQSGSVPGHLHPFCIVPTSYLSNSPLSLKPQRVHEPRGAAALPYFSPVPPLNHQLSEEIIAVLLLCGKLQKAVTTATTTMKSMVCRYIKLHFPSCGSKGGFPTGTGTWSQLILPPLSKLSKLWAGGDYICILFFFSCVCVSVTPQ